MIANRLYPHTSYSEDGLAEGIRLDTTPEASPSSACESNSTPVHVSPPVIETLTSERIISSLKHDPLLDPTSTRPYQLFTFQLGLELVLDNYVIDDSVREKFPDDQPVFNDTTIAQIGQHSKALELNFKRCAVDGCNFFTESSSVKIFLIYFEESF
jgi:hypothetical protein